MKRMTPAIAVFVAFSLIVALTSVLFLAEVLLKVPFPAFDLFDFISRTLPGDVVTFGIDTMVDTITALNIGRTDTVAKTAEQLMAVGAFVSVGFVSGVVYLLATKSLLKNPVTYKRDTLLSGVIFGLAFGIPMIAISSDINSSATASSSLSTLWMLVAFSGWGLAHGFVLRRFGIESSEEVQAQDASAHALNRRQFLVQLGASTATITVAGTGLASILNSRLTEEGTSEVIEVAKSAEELLASKPNADAEVIPVSGTRPEYTPLEDHYRIDISSGRPPNINAAEYKLKIGGLVDNPLELALDEIQNNYEPMNQFITMSCISNRLGGDLISTTLWTGISMQRILELVQPQENATHIKILGADGFDEIVALDIIREDERVMLTYAWDNQPLLAKHGFPLRIHIPDRFGMKQPKWITEMEFIPEWEEGYWVRRGWSADAIAVTTSVIDTVAVDSPIADGEQQFIPIGGMAWAGARGISKVEVQINEGEWNEALLRTPLSDKAWVIWRYDWPFEAGNHNIHVRCYDGDGNMQIESSRGVRPDGATGIHEETASIEV